MMYSDTPIGEKQLVVGTVLHAPESIDTSAKETGRVTFTLVSDTGNEELVCAYEHDFPQGLLADITVGQRLNVIATAFHCADILNEFHATRIEVRDD